MVLFQFRCHWEPYAKFLQFPCRKRQCNRPSSPFSEAFLPEIWKEHWAAVNHNVTAGRDVAFCRIGLVFSVWIRNTQRQMICAFRVSSVDFIFSLRRFAVAFLCFVSDRVRTEPDVIRTQYFSVFQQIKFSFGFLHQNLISRFFRQKQTPDGRCCQKCQHCQQQRKDVNPAHSHLCLL